LGTAQTAALMVGLALVAVGLFALWLRNDIYTALRATIRYPNHGIAYGLIHVIGPLILIFGGGGLIIAWFLR
jgi:hypothetical protein